METSQKAQGEKMVDSVAAYVALTKRVSETETRNEALDNKIEETTSDYLKLDRKIDKAIEDRNRILRKVDRIEQAVLETRDALNAKAMVLLTDQGAVAGVNMPQVTDEVLQTDPSVLNRRLQEENSLPWWRKSVRIQGTSLGLMVIVVLLLGWILSESQRSSFNQQINRADAPPPTISLHTPSTKDNNASEQYSQNNDATSNSIYADNDVDNGIGEYSYDNPYAQKPDAQESIYDTNANIESSEPVYAHEETAEEIYEKAIKTASENTSPDDSYGITIHKGYDKEDFGKGANNKNSTETLDIYNSEQMSNAFDEDPEQVAKRLNQIEPQSLTTQDKYDAPQINQNNVASTTSPPSQGQYIKELKQRINPDRNLTDIAKKIEKQAFAGVPEAQHDMGAIYVAGHGKIKQDLDRAILWFTEAADNGVANAKYNLGVLHHQGLGVNKNIDRAMSLYEDAAELGHPEAQYNLGIAHIEGIGVSYSPKKAAYFFQMAANKKVTEAAYNLGLIYENGLLGETRPDDALLWYKKAADQGSPEAQSALDQLASSLGIGVNEVNMIVSNLQKSGKKSQINYNSGSASSNSTEYLTSQIQEELIRRGLYPGPVDGMSGPMTTDAIKSFQTAAGLYVDGKPSQKLLSYLKR